MYHRKSKFPKPKGDPPETSGGAQVPNKEGYSEPKLRNQKYSLFEDTTD
jgi:hypothetical protein